MFNQNNKSNQPKSNNGRSSSNNDLMERRAHTNAIFDEMLHSSRSVNNNNIRERTEINAIEQIRARAIADDRQRRLADSRIEARLAPVYDRYQNYDRDRIIQRQIDQTAARMNAFEREATRMMEEERARMNVNWRGPSNSSSTAFSNKNSNSSKYNKK